MIAILGREEVAQIRGFPIYVIKTVVLIPISSQSEAETVIRKAQESVKKGQASLKVDSDTSDEEGVYSEAAATEGGQTSPASSESPTKEDAIGARLDASNRDFSKVAEDVISKKGQYGRFTERWFSKKGWSTEKRRAQGMSTDNTEKPRPNSVHEVLPTSHSGPEGLKSLDESAETDGPIRYSANALMPKLLRTTRMLLESRSFFFSYDLDITRRVGTQGITSPELPLNKSVDPLFFWNGHLISPVIEGGHHSFVLPLIQGFVGQRAFNVKEEAENPSKAISSAQQGAASLVENQDPLDHSSDEVKFLITLVSRRSTKRPGLRYLRRGVDENGDTANTVETEQILSKASWASSERVYSFTQVRGSIPLFFSQSPYSFKPVPVLQHSPDINQRAFRRHFGDLVRRYGDVQIVLLLDKKGREAEIGQRYEESATSLNVEGGIEGKKIGFEWFDFHAVCRGMKFENVTLLLDSLDAKLRELGDTVEIEGRIQRRQSGILRTNCMDCLDRTNVVQSACGQRALEQQLRAEGAIVDLFTDPNTQWFNMLWADNGDQISREYSSTAALKGDYTRTRQRNYRGAINDLGLTLSRYYNNIINGRDIVCYVHENILIKVRLLLPGRNRLPFRACHISDL